MDRKGEFLQSEEHLASTQDSMGGNGKTASDDYGFEIVPRRHHSKEQDTLPLPPPFHLGDLGGGVQQDEDCTPMPEAIYAAPGDAAATGGDMDTMGKIPRKAASLINYTCRDGPGIKEVHCSHSLLYNYNCAMHNFIL